MVLLVKSGVTERGNEPLSKLGEKFVEVATRSTQRLICFGSLKIITEQAHRVGKSVEVLVADDPCLFCVLHPLAQGQIYRSLFSRRHWGLAGGTVGTVTVLPHDVGQHSLHS